MPDLKNAFTCEIRRLAKKEVKAALQAFHGQVSAQRKTLVELKARVNALEKRIPTAPKPAKDIIPVSGKTVRMSPQWIIKIRQKLGLTQGQLAVLLGSNNFSVSHWELGKTTPRDAFKRKIAALRGIGKRELKQLLEEKGFVAVEGKVKVAKTVVEPNAKKVPVKIKAALAKKSEVKSVPAGKKQIKANPASKPVKTSATVKPVPKVATSKASAKTVTIVAPKSVATRKSKAKPVSIKAEPPVIAKTPELELKPAAPVKTPGKAKKAAVKPVKKEIAVPGKVETQVTKAESVPAKA